MHWRTHLSCARCSADAGRLNDVVASTARLRLRGWRDADDAVLAAIRTPGFLAWLEDDAMPVRRPGPAAPRMRAAEAEHGHCFWVVESAADGAMIGYCGLKRVDAEGTCLTGAKEIGWGIAEHAQGRGLATEAARAALDRAFTVHGAPFVVAFTVAGNAASRRVMDKLGMTRRPDLDYHDPAYSAALNPTLVYRIDRAYAVRG